MKGKLINPGEFRPIRLCLAVLAIIFFSAGAALGGAHESNTLKQFVHANWEANSDLPVTTIHALAQDLNGYLWLGTLDGLIRFDGVKFTLFRNETHPGLVSNNIRKLISGSDGSIWIGTEEAGLVRMKNGVFTHYGREQNLKDHHIFCLGEAPDGSIYIGTRSEGLFRLAKNLIEKVPRPVDAPPDIHALHITKSGTVYVGSLDGTLAQISPGGYRKIYADWPRRGIYSIIDNKKGGILIGSESIGISELLKEEDEETHLWNIGMPKISITTTMAFDREGGLWLADSTFGLARFAGGEWSTYKSSDGLSYDAVTSLLLDKEGNMWAGTKAGLDRFYKGPFTPWVLSSTLPNRMVTSLTLDIKGDLWAATYMGNLVTKHNNEITIIPANEALTTTITAVAKRAAGGVWVGSYLGLGWADESGYNPINPVSPDLYNSLISIYEDESGTLWLGTDNRALIRLQTNGVATVIGESEGLGRSSVRHIAMDPFGGLWLATQDKGVAHLNVDGKIDRLISEKEGLGDDSVRHVFVEPRGVVWAGLRDGGLTRIEGTNIYNFNNSNGFPTDRVSGIINDDLGNLWMTTHRGVLRASIQRLDRIAKGDNREPPDFRIFNQLDGLSTTECELNYGPTVVRGSGGKIYIANRLGFCALAPEIVDNSRPKAPQVQIESVLIDSKEIPLEKAKLIPPSQGRVTIIYNVPILRYAKQVRFEHRLLGFETDWTSGQSATREVTYSALQPGSYQFEVRAAMPDQKWPDIATQFAFTLRPHFYQTVYFYLAIAAGIACMGLLAYWIRLRSITQRSRQLESEVSVRTSELRAEIVERKKAEEALRELPGKIIEAQEGERQRVSMELHDSVNQLLASIRFRVQYIMAALPPEGALFDAASKTNEHLKHALDEVRRISRNLRPSELDDFGLNSATISAAKDFRERNTGVRLDMELTDLPERLPRDIELVVYRIVQEALTNIEKHSKASNVKISLGCNEPSLHLEICDNGRGFNSKLSTSRGHSNNATGIGLSSIQQRAASVGGKCSIWSAPEQGTIIRIEIPITLATPAINA